VIDRALEHIRPGKPIVPSDPEALEPRATLLS